MTKFPRKVVVTGLLFFALPGALVLYGFSPPEDAAASPVYRTDPSSVPKLTAPSWLVYDVSQGQILYEHNPDEVLPIASVTKLVTAKAFYKNNDPQDTITIKWSDTAAEGRAGKLSYGETYTNHELLFPLLLESSNDAAFALARVDSTLLERMNQYAQQLELQHTVFTDTSGLSSGNVSNARELMKLSRDLYDTAPHIIDITRIPEYYAKDNGWINNNPFVHDDAYRGGKHGYTHEANRTFVGFFDEVFAGQTRTLGYVLLGSDDIAKEVADLRAYVAHHTTYQ